MKAPLIAAVRMKDTTPMIHCFLQNARVTAKMKEVTKGTMSIGGSAG
jgi:hypothetical protein